MKREYDLFEMFPDGSSMWRGHVSGLQNVRLQLQLLAKETTNECVAMHLPTQEIAARINANRGKKSRKPFVFQIAYDDKLGADRAQALRHQGYEVLSVMGNEAAKVVLSLPQHCDFFIIGHAAPIETRREMVAWLKSGYPGVPILALNPPTIRQLDGADYNAIINGPETWLPLIVTGLNGASTIGP